jgi:hypothetical protein
LATSVPLELTKMKPDDQVVRINLKGTSTDQAASFLNALKPAAAQLMVRCCLVWFVRGRHTAMIRDGDLKRFIG